MTDVVWQAIIAALLAAYMEWSRRKTADKVAAAAIKVEEVKETLHVAAIKVEEVKEVLKEKTSKDEEQFASVAAKVDTVAAKVEEVRKAGFAQGVKSETDKQAGEKP